MTVVNGNGNGPSSMRFTVSQVIQLLTAAALGYAAFASLKGDLREGFAQVGGRLNDHEHRIGTLESHDDRRYEASRERHRGQ